jgi:aminopeptidase N
VTWKVTVTALASCLAAWTPIATAIEPPLAIDVLRYHATITPVVESRSLTGSVAITFRPRAAGFAEVSFDSGDLVVERVTENGASREFQQRERRVFVTLGRSLPVASEITLVFTYHGSPRRGLVFNSNQEQAYTIFSTREWMIAADTPADKAAFRLALHVPEGLRVVASGRHIGDRALGNGRVVSEWIEERPMPSYTFGFAVGDYNAINVPWGTRTLTHLGANVSAGDLRRALAGTADVLEYFERVSGVPYRFDAYTQIVTGNGVGQEVNRFAVLPEAVVRDAPEGRTWLGVHEIAHQWWGNSVTCVDWRHFWLNEGLATFMAAAYLEHAEGPAAYERQIASSRERFERVRENGHDKPLVFPDWERPTADDRTIVYHKGAYVLSLLRAEIGDTAFWSGIRTFTTRFENASVDTADFVRVMEDAGGRSLTDFAARWIYGTQR